MSGIMNMFVATKTTIATAVDAFFNSVSLLLNTSSTNGAQNNTFLDSSTNNFTITRNGNATQGTFTPFSQTGWSNYFDGSGDYLTAASNSAFAFGTGSFTWETWFYSTGAVSRDVCFYDLGSGNTTGGFAVFTTGSLLYVRINGTGQDLTYTLTSSWINAWHHLAVVRNGTTLTIYLDGVSVASGTRSQDVTQSSPYIGNGAGVFASYPLLGYLSNMRVVKGTAVYTAAFTPPTAPLTAISGTSLLTCQSNRFADSSTNAFALTVNGNPSVQAFEPFEPGSAYSTSVVGGSGYFDGTGDYLITANNAALNVGSGNFCIEAFFYASTVATQQPIISNAGAAGTDNTQIDIVSGNIRFASAGSQWLLGNAVTVNSWNHVAVCRTSTTMSLFLNGVRQATATNSTNFANANNYSMNVGRAADGSVLFTGYISNPRIVKGSTPYDATQTTLTVPTAPLTAITNTSYLLNLTNAGIYDSAAKNVLETVGNAQVSTTQAKWGTTSMYFDGTGDYLLLQAGPNLALGSGDFTIEMWFYVTTTAAVQALMDFRPTGTDGVYPLIYISASGTSIILDVSSGTRITGTTTISTNTWYHFALSRSGSSTKMFVNGTQVGSTYTDTNNYLVGTNRPVIAGNGFTLGNNPLTGYMDDVRITKGYARYTTTFTPPTAALPTQ